MVTMYDSYLRARHRANSYMHHLMHSTRKLFTAGTNCIFILQMTELRPRDII